MAKHINMTAALRDRAGKGNARATRRMGKVPAVIYGDNKAPVLISIENIQVIKALHSGHLFTQLCDLDIEGENHLVLARDVQLHPVKDTPVHVDFLRVSEKTVITVEVPVHAIDEEEVSPGVKAGGVVMLAYHSLEISCRADRIPGSIDIDISTMEIGDSVKVEDLKLPNNVKATLDPTATVLSIAAPKVQTEDAAEDAADAMDNVEVTEQGGETAEEDSAEDKK